MATWQTSSHCVSKWWLRGKQAVAAGAKQQWSSNDLMQCFSGKQTFAIVSSEKESILGNWPSACYNHKDKQRLYRFLITACWHKIMRRLYSLQAGFTFTTNTKAIGVLQELLPIVAYSPGFHPGNKCHWSTAGKGHSGASFLMLIALDGGLPERR